MSASLPSARQHQSYRMVIVCRLRGNIIRTAPCWVVWHNVHSQQHTNVSSSYRSSRLGLSHWDPYAMHRGGCLELYYCNMVEWCWWDSSLIWKTDWLPSVLWHYWFGHYRPRYDLCVRWDVKPCSINLGPTFTVDSDNIHEHAAAHSCHQCYPGHCCNEKMSVWCYYYALHGFIVVQFM